MTYDFGLPEGATRDNRWRLEVNSYAGVVPGAKHYMGRLMTNTYLPVEGEEDTWLPETPTPAPCDDAADHPAHWWAGSQFCYGQGPTL